MGENKLKKGQATTILKSIRNFNSALNLDGIAKPDDPLYTPIQLSDSWSTVSPKLDSRLQIGFRTTVAVDCGISLELPSGFSIKATPTPEMAMKGLFVNTVFLRDNRLLIVVTNIGKEIIVFEDKKQFAKIAIERCY